AVGLHVLEQPLRRRQRAAGVVCLQAVVAAAVHQHDFDRALVDTILVLVGDRVAAPRQRGAADGIVAVRLAGAEGARGARVLLDRTRESVGERDERLADHEDLVGRDGAGLAGHGAGRAGLWRGVARGTAGPRGATGARAARGRARGG